MKALRYPSALRELTNVLLGQSPRDMIVSIEAMVKDVSSRDDQSALTCSSRILEALVAKAAMSRDCKKTEFFKRTHSAYATVRPLRRWSRPA